MSADIYAKHFTTAREWDHALELINICREAGIPSEQILVSSWPAPSLEQGVVANPYCDNLNFFGFDHNEVTCQLRRLIAGFHKHGFDLHEIEWARPLARPLGSEFNGNTSVLGPREEKMLTLRSACRWLQAGRRVSGRQLQIVVGLLTHEFLYHMSASILRSVKQAKGGHLRKANSGKEPHGF